MHDESWHGADLIRMILMSSKLAAPDPEHSVNLLLKDHNIGAVCIAGDTNESCS